MTLFWYQMLFVLFLVVAVHGDVPPRSSVQEPEPVIPYDYPQTLPNKQTMVQLFEWKWTDIAKECEDFLQYWGYGAVQVSPPQEHVVLYKDGDIPWWVVYQPVSYKLDSRDGTEAEFKDMVERCNKVGVRIVVDAVLNHMVGEGLVYGVNGAYSSAGSYFDGTPGAESFPEVPYCTTDTNDFRCNRSITDSDFTNNATNIRICRLVGLIDLDQGSECVRGKMVEYLNRMIDMGVAGFRFDAAKHIFPKNLHSIIYDLKDLREDIFGKNQRPFCVHEVSDEYGTGPIKAPEYLDEKIGRYTDFDYGRYISHIIWRSPGYQEFGDLQWWGEGYGYGEFKSTDILGFIDNHDTQRDRPPSVLTYRDGEKYALAVGFMLAWNYGYPRVMSSYAFDPDNFNQGPPHLKDVYLIKSPEIDPEYDTCLPSSGWVCEHRWQAIRGMALFRQYVMGTKTTIFNGEWQTLAFSRDGKGFFAANNGDNPWSTRLQTKLPAGVYCEVFTGQLKSDGSCSGKEISVDNDGFASFEVPPRQFVAMHVGMKAK